MMATLEQRKTKYSADVRAELELRGVLDVDKVIGKTGFVSALNKYPEEQMHYSVKDAVNEILLVAASN